MAPSATYQNHIFTVDTQSDIRSLTDVESHPAGGLGSVKNFGNSLKMGNSNKFERFNDGLEMSESTRRMEGFGSGR